MILPPMLDGTMLYPPHVGQSQAQICVRTIQSNNEFYSGLSVNHRIRQYVHIELIHIENIHDLHVVPSIDSNDDLPSQGQ